MFEVAESSSRNDNATPSFCPQVTLAFKSQMLQMLLKLIAAAKDLFKIQMLLSKVTLGFPIEVVN